MALRYFYLNQSHQKDHDRRRYICIFSGVRWPFSARSFDDFVASPALLAFMKALHAKL